MDSEQQEHLELADDPAADNPPSWQIDATHGRERTGPGPDRQVTTPDQDVVDTEPDAVAEDAGPAADVGPEEQALHVEPGER
jgi:hypothetical protein